MLSPTGSHRPRPPLARPHGRPRGPEGFKSPHRPARNVLPLLGFLIVVADIASLFFVTDLAQQVGLDWWAWYWTIAYVLLVAFIGVWVIRLGGAWSTIRVAYTASRGQQPTKELADGFFYLAGGALLVTPGILSDALGLIFILPVTRIPLRMLLFALLRRKARKAMAARQPEVIEVKDFKVE